MKFLALLGLAPAAACAADVPPVIQQEPPATMRIMMDATAAPLDRVEGPDGLRGTLDVAPHPAEAVLDQMVRAFQAGLVIHGDDRSAMADALMALRNADIRTPEFTGPGKRHASAKAERRFRSVLDALILNGTGEPTGWRAPDGQPCA